MSSPSCPPPAAPVLLETRRDGTATLVMNRPERMNALNNELACALDSALDRIAKDQTVRVVVLTGAGRAFCSGGDLALIGKGRETGDSRALEPLLRAGMQAVLKIRTLPQPVIAAVNGAAAGAGMNLALAADLRLASEEAVFGESFSKVGLFPDYGGTYFLPQLVGPALAAELFYTGEMIDANRALSLGIVNHVFPSAIFEQEVARRAENIALGPPLAIRALKRTVYGQDLSALQSALEHEVEEQLRCFLSEDCREGIRAFFEKRPPSFSGK